MSKQEKYRIVCEYPSDKWVVQERMPNGDWMSAHHCTDKGKEGYEEAKKWIEKQPE